MTPPSIDDPTSDVERLRRALKISGQCKSDAGIDLDLVKEMAEVLRHSKWDVSVVLNKEDEKDSVISVRKKGHLHNFGLAIDVGTTTVVVELVDLSSGKIVGRASAYNKQISCGDDIISRIVFAGKGDGLKKLQNLITNTINEVIGDLLEFHHVSKDDITFVTAAGNTTMTHLLFGVSPKYIREEPYIPTANYFPVIKANKLGIDLPYAQIYSYPCMASYVGGDIVAGLLAIDIENTEKLTLFIDVGTNGEMVLGNKDWLIGCSCSAGPAFEGGGVKDGMRATEGAIELVRISPATLKPSTITIGRQKPVGICGSGLIDAIAELFITGGVSQNGKLNKEIGAKNIIVSNGSAKYRLCNAKMSGTGKDISVTEIDIDNLMRAKGAVYSGMMTLLESVNQKVSDIEEVLIAGAFGNYLDIDKAITIGLLPDLDRDKFTFVGNGSLLGARLALLSMEARKKAEQIASKLTYLDLSSTSSYMDKYVSALFFPHTDLNLFPSVKEKLSKGVSQI